MHTVLIARHGNTFDKGDTLLRVGKKTDLPLSTSGKTQAQRLGEYLTAKHPTIDQVIVSNLQRTQQTASIALETMALQCKVATNDFLDEIDYGPDEGKPETDVIARIGTDALARWETDAIVPAGWLVNPTALIEGWKNLATKLAATAPNTTILIVTSNGIARFAPYLLSNIDTFKQQHSIKMKTGAISCFEYDKQWHCRYWNIQPPK